jgi:hypothetical protein
MLCSKVSLLGWRSFLEGGDFMLQCAVFTLIGDQAKFGPEKMNTWLAEISRSHTVMFVTQSSATNSHEVIITVVTVFYAPNTESRLLK